MTVLQAVLESDSQVAKVVQVWRMGPLGMQQQRQQQLRPRRLRQCN
jgi:hypothetical protein